MLNRRRLLFASAAALPGITLATSARARKRKPNPKPKPKWHWKTVTRTFASSQPITIPTAGVATPFPAKLRVQGPPNGRIQKITVSLFDLTHGYQDDLDILLVAPGGSSTILMSDAGYTNPNLPPTVPALTFDDHAPLRLPMWPSYIAGGTYKPTNFAADAPDVFPNPPGSPGPSLATFKGGKPNGVWSLYVMDDFGTDIGSIGGWSLKITARVKVKAKRKPKSKQRRKARGTGR